MRVYVANPTLQHRVVHYRVPGQRTARAVSIRAGGHVFLPDDLDGDVLKNVIKQLQEIGGVDQRNVNAIVHPKQLIFDVQKQIDIGTIEDGFARDEDARQAVSAEMMEKGGLAAYDTATRTAPAGRKVIETSVEVVEVTDAGRVKGGVNHEVVVSEKPSRRASRLRTEDKA